MSSRTYPLSRQRRRPLSRSLVPVEDGERLAAPGDNPAGEADLAGETSEREPARERTTAGQPADDATQSAGARPAAPRLPHEHDEHADAPHAPRAPIVQAASDLREGQQDTDLRGQAAEAFKNAGRRR